MDTVEHKTVNKQDVELSRVGDGDYMVCVNGHEIDSGSINNMRCSYKAAIKTLEAIEG